MPIENFPKRSEIHLTQEESVEYVRHLATAFQIRLIKSAREAIPLSLDENRAWKMLLEKIDITALGEASEVIDSLLTSIDRNIKIQSRMELKRPRDFDDIP